MTTSIGRGSDEGDFRFGHRPLRDSLKRLNLEHVNGDALTGSVLLGFANGMLFKKSAKGPAPANLDARIDRKDATAILLSIQSEQIGQRSKFDFSFGALKLDCRAAAAGRSDTARQRSLPSGLGRYHREESQRSNRFAVAAGNLLLMYALARRQDRRRHARRKRLLLSVGRSQCHELVRGDRKAHDFIRREFRGIGSDCAYHESCGCCDRQAVPHSHLRW